MTVLSPSGDGILVGSAHGGSLYRLGAAAAESGHYDSVPFDTNGRFSVGPPVVARRSSRGVCHRDPDKKRKHLPTRCELEQMVGSAQ